jgi:hypothetical protein
MKDGRAIEGRKINEERNKERTEGRTKEGKG